MTLRPEDKVVQALIQKLQDIGWKDGSSIVNFREHQLVEGFFLEKFFEKKFKEINEEILSYLPPDEEREVLDYVKTELRNADEVKMLDYLKYGIEVVVEKEKVKFKLIDYDNPKNNAFFFLRNAKFRGSPDNIKPDVTLFVNGVPLVIIEVKQETKPYSYIEAINQIRRYEKYSPELFRFVQFAVAYGDLKRYTPTIPNWSKEDLDIPSFNWIVEENINGERIKKEDITYLLKPEVVLEFIKYFTFYRKTSDAGYDKIVARYNQYYATKRAIERINEHLSGKEKNRGLVWHWQGSGKTYTMFFIANYILDRYYHTHPIIFFIVDRVDLEKQLDKMLSAVHETKFKALLKKIESIPQLHDLIKTIKESEMFDNVIARGIYITTIQKFQRGSFSEEEDREMTKGLQNILIELGKRYLEYLKEKDPKKYEVHVQELNKRNDKAKIEYLIQLGQIKRKNILLLIDEAHRSQYGLLASMRKATFPNAVAFGFTGTPIFKHERNTFNEFAYPEFGEYYLHVYFIEDSIRDGFTLPLTYHVLKEGEIDAEGVRIKLSEEEIKGFIKEYMERRGRIDEELELEVSRKDIQSYINTAKVILLNPKRIDKMAKYIADRIAEDTENFKFKAMVVAVNRLGCVRYKRALDKYLMEKFGEEARNWSEVVMTYNYNDTNKEIIEYKEELIKRRGKKDLNEINSDIQREFLEKENPKILIVTDMLLTGFDAPMLKVMYLDKPLYEHRLLQAVARVNRPYKDKEFGLIVDSIGLLEHLTKTMALYNMLAEEDIRKDFEENLFKPIDEKVTEFEIRFASLKEELKGLEVNGENLSIDLDLLKNQLKNRTLDEADFDAKVSAIALYASTREGIEVALKVIRLLNEMGYILKLYKALGSHPKKLLYVEDVETLAYVYYKIRQKMSGKRRKLSKVFWEELTSFIHNKTIIEDFKKVGDAEISAEKLDELLKGKASLRDLQRALADYYFELRNTLMQKPHDPIYREILEKLENLRLQWITRAINTRLFLAQLKVLKEQKENYDRRVAGKPLVDRIAESISVCIGTQLLNGQKIELELRNTKKAINNVLKRKRTAGITPIHKKNLRTALLKDLLLELKKKVSGIDINETEVAKLADRIVDEFIIEELERM